MSERSWLLGKTGKQGGGWWQGRLIKARKKRISVGMKDGKQGMGGMESWGLGAGGAL